MRSLFKSVDLEKLDRQLIAEGLEDKTNHH